ncbi:MAG: glycoside hydrolase family 3 N-terminal domain-containing protein [Angustibacter sp.]
MTRRLLGAGAVLALAAACSAAPSGGARTSAPTPPATSSTSSTSVTSTPPVTSTAPSTPPTSSTRPPDDAQRALARLTLAQRVGQLLMVGTRAGHADGDTLRAVGRYHAGNVMLTGRSSAGVEATATVSARLQRAATRSATGGVPLLVATDQEGGQVQVLSGPGFSTIPTALTQGTWSTATLRDRAAQWGRQLRSAGVQLDLAPVADTVPESLGRSNAPIGRYSREFGHDPDTVGAHATAFAAGLKAADVAVSVKHFPGLGRVRDNTDTASGVTDTTTTRTDPYLQPFREAIAAGAPMVMMSSAVYREIDDDGPACFSPTVVTGLLRGDLGFDGVVISDDLGEAEQVQRWSAGSRAVQLVAAGGDVVLTVDPGDAPAMYTALYAKASSDKDFRAKVDAAALRVLRLKAAYGVLG